MFRFKAFNIYDDLAAMKVGTDAVLLGAWVSVEEIRTILDIGTGSGILSLQMAQRCPLARIDAVEIDGDSAAQARQNAAATPWNDRIKVHTISIQEYASLSQPGYDLIICNPPFYYNSLKSNDQRKCISRHDDLLPLDDLLRITSLLLAPGGRAAFIHPATEHPRWESSSQRHGLYPLTECLVISREGKPVTRIMTEYCHSSYAEKVSHTLTINDREGNFTMEYKNLTGEFYLGLP